MVSILNSPVAAAGLPGSLGLPGALTPLTGEVSDPLLYGSGILPKLSKARTEGEPLVVGGETGDRMGEGERAPGDVTLAVPERVDACREVWSACSA